MIIENIRVSSIRHDDENFDRFLQENCGTTTLGTFLFLFRTLKHAFIYKKTLVTKDGDRKSISEHIFATLPTAYCPFRNGHGNGNGKMIT